jgi:hypothetical protein
MLHCLLRCVWGLTTVLAFSPRPQCCSHEEIRGLRELFKSFDKNGDGHITLDELREGLSARGVLQDGEVEQVWGPMGAGLRA